MSHDATAWAWTVPDLGTSERLVLLRLADRARVATGQAWPKVATIATDTGLSERAVQYALSQLERRGLVIRAWSGGRGTPTTYTLQNGAPAAPFQTGKGATPEQKGAPGAGKGARGAPPIGTRKEPGIKTNREKPSRAATKSVEHVTPELLPARAPNGARGELATGLDLDQLIAQVRDQRTPTLTRQQATQARRLARDALEAGWDPRLIVAALVATSAFTSGAFTFAVDQLRRQVISDRKSRLTKFEQSEL